MLRFARRRRCRQCRCHQRRRRSPRRPHTDAGADAAANPGCRVLWLCARMDAPRRAQRFAPRTQGAAQPLARPFSVWWVKIFFSSFFFFFRTSPQYQVEGDAQKNQYQVEGDARQYQVEGDAQKKSLRPLLRGLCGAHRRPSAPTCMPETSGHVPRAMGGAGWRAVLRASDAGRRAAPLCLSFVLCPYWR